MKLLSCKQYIMFVETDCAGNEELTDVDCEFIMDALNFHKPFNAKAAAYLKTKA